MKLLSNVKRKDWPLLSLMALLALSFAAVFPVSATNGAKVFVDPASIITDTAQNPVNSTIQVNVTIANMTGLYGLEFKMRWNSSLLTGVSMEDLLFGDVPPGEEGNVWKLKHVVSPDEVWYSYTYMDAEQAIAGGYAPIDINVTTNPPDGKRTVAVVTLQVEREPTITEGFLETALEIYVSKAGDMLADPITHVVEDGYFKLDLYIDDIPPSIEPPTREPAGDVSPDQEVEVSVNVTDVHSGVKNVTLSYTTDEGVSWSNVTMSYNSGTSLYEGTIPGQTADATVEFKIVAFDNSNNSAVEDNAGAYYVYVVIPEFQTLLSLFVTIFVITALIILIKRKRKPNQLSIPEQTT